MRIKDRKGGEQMEKGKGGRDWFFIGMCVLLAGCLVFLAVYEGIKRQRTQEEIRLAIERFHEEEAPRHALSQKVQQMVTEEMEKSLPRIVCLGDAYMAGNQKGSLPFQFFRLMNEEILGDLNGRISFYLRQMNQTSLRIPVENLGVLQESMAMVLSRFGGNALYLKEDMTLSAKGDPVPLDFTDDSGEYLLAATQPFCHFGLVTIGEVEGHIYNTGDKKDEVHYQTAFRPDTPTEEVSFPAGTPVILETQQAYAGDVAIFFFGENSWETDSKEELTNKEAREYVEGIQNIVKARGEAGPAFVVLGRAREGELLDTLYQEAFGDAYVRVVDKELSNLGQDDFTRMARLSFESLSSQGAFEGVKEMANRALSIWEESF